MIRKLATCTAFMALGLLLFATSALASEVAQGKLLSYTPNQAMIIEEYDINFSEEMRYGHPTGIESTFTVTPATKYGAAPTPGDILRIAYVVDGNTKKALKVMNVTRQNLMNK